jgi:methylglutaconyl-CoA hydratase
MNTYNTLEIEYNPMTAVVWLNRPDVRNALDVEMISELQRAFTELGEAEHIRAIVLAARGKAFCAGADLNYMQSMSQFSEIENIVDATKLATMLATIDTCPLPVVARVHGACFAGGVGLASVCDVVVASHEASFCLSEVRLGLVPATISPYVVRAMGYQAARRYCISAERFDAAEAYRIGFAHEICEASELDDAINVVLGSLVQGAKGAIHTTKALLKHVADAPIDASLKQYTARCIAQARASAEGREGIDAFLNRREPSFKPRLE